MKKLVMILGATLMTVALTACPDKGGGGDKFVSSPTSCFQGNYYYNSATGQYVDRTTGQVVNCNQGYFNGYNNNYLPYNSMFGGQYMQGCESWTGSYYGGQYITAQYVGVNIAGYGPICVRTDYFGSVPGWNSYQNYWGYSGYPNTARFCQYGVNCPTGCYAGAGLSAGAQVGPFWLGGTLAMCY